MQTRRRQHTLQLSLLQTRPCLPAWSSLPERSRQEVVALLMTLLEQHAATAAAGGRHGDDDE